MSQKPANSRGLTSEAIATDENGAAEISGESREAAAAVLGKRLSPAASPHGAHASHHRPSGSAIAAQARATPVARAATGPVRAVAANDDMPSIGGLIYALQQRPSKSPFYIALGASAIWFVLGCLIAWSVINRADEVQSIGDIFATPSIVAVIATIVVPIALFWFLAILVWRAQELRLMSSAMTEVAVRLAEPDKMAEQSVASLGQTVRRQVAAMNDAISRALGRAGELEALVHNEVAALERSYTENENRIRNLINELASEREALANNSERVSEALRGIGSHVTREISAASERASQSMSQATSMLADTLASRGNKITAAVTAAGAAIDEKLAERGARITEQLVKHGAQAAEKLHQSGLEVTRAVQETSDRAAAAISARGNNLVASVMSMSERVGREIPVLLDRLGGEQQRLSGIIEGATKNLSALEGALAQRTESLNTSLHDRTKMLQTVLTEQTKAMDHSLAERTQALETILGRRAQAFDQSLAERSKALDQSVARYTGNIRETLEQHSRGMEKSLGRQAQHIEQVVTGTASQIQRAVDELASRAGGSSEALTNQAQVLKEVSSGLLGQIHGLTKRFEDQGANIMNAARAMEVQNSKIDSVMEARQGQLTKLLDGVNARAGELDRMMNGYSNMLEQSLAQAEVRARQVMEMLARDNADKSQTAMKELERLRAEAQAHTSRAISELKTSFTSLSEQVSSQLSGFTTRVNETTRQVRDSATQAATELETTQAELRRQAKTLPEATKQSATAMRRALQDQLSALDSLTEITSRHGYANQVAKAEPRQSAPAPAAPPPVAHHHHTPAPESRETSSREIPARDMASRDIPSRDIPSRDIPSRDMPPMDLGRREPQHHGGYGDKWPATPESIEAVSAGLIERMGSQTPVTPVPDYESMGRPPVPSQDMGQDRRGGGNMGGSGAQWSLGDLLARASEDDEPFGHHPEDHSYGMPPMEHMRQPEPSPKLDAASPMIFDMKDIASAVDEHVAAEVWMRFNKGERHVVSRSMYNRGGQATFDQVKRRYEGDTTFRHIVDRYIADFERMLKDAGKADPKGRALQQHLTSETGRIYLVLAHASGRLV
jgi:hypothetical protein